MEDDRRTSVAVENMHVYGGTGISTRGARGDFPWPILGMVALLLGFACWTLDPRTPGVPSAWRLFAAIGLAFAIPATLWAWRVDTGGWLVERLEAMAKSLTQASPLWLARRAIELLDKFYGERVISLRAFRRSSLLSTSAFVLLTVMLTIRLYSVVESTAVPDIWEAAVPLALGWWVLNVFSDFVSVACTRKLLSMVCGSHERATLRFGVFLLVDTVLLLTLALVPTGLAGSAMIAWAAPAGTVAHKVVWWDYLLGSLIGFGAEPILVMSSLRWIIGLTLFTACIPSVFVWNVLAMALVWRVGQGALFEALANGIMQLRSVRTVVIWTYSVYVVTLLAVGVAIARTGGTDESPEQDLTVGLIERNCSRGVSLSCSYQGYLYHYGYGVEPDLVRAHEFYRQACIGEELAGCVGVGFMYQHGKGGVDEDDARARALYERACDGGNMSGCNNLGSLHESGEGVEHQDLVRASQLYERACGEDNLMACNNLAALHQKGQGVDEDDVYARELFGRACDGGIMVACMNLGQMYRLGEGGDTDEARVRDIYSRVCAEGHMKGCVGLGTIYQYGHGVEPDHHHALSLYEQACDSGDSRGCNRLGLFYEDVYQDRRRASSSYKQACDLGYLDGCFNLAAIYDYGYSGMLDNVQAREVYGKACKAGHSASCGRLGALHMKGHGGSLDVEIGLEMYEKACLGEDSDSCRELGDYYAAKGGEASLARARQYYELGCELAEGKSCVRLGEMFEVGVGGNVDRDRAREMYDVACEYGEGEGCHSLTDLDRLSSIRAVMREMVALCDGGRMEGCHELAALYEHHRSDFLVDPLAILRLYTQACSGQYADSCLALGDIYYGYRDVIWSDEKTPDEYSSYLTVSMSDSVALKYYEMACGAGSAFGCNATGNHAFLLNDDFQQAAMAYSAGCDGGHGDSCNSLGVLREYVSQGSLTDAAEAYEKACRMGSGAGCYNKVRVFELRGGEKGEADAMYERFCSSATLTHAASCLNYLSRALRPEDLSVLARFGYFRGQRREGRPYPMGEMVAWIPKNEVLSTQHRLSEIAGVEEGLRTYSELERQLSMEGFIADVDFWDQLDQDVEFVYVQLSIVTEKLFRGGSVPIAVGKWFDRCELDERKACIWLGLDENAQALKYSDTRMLHYPDRGPRSESLGETDDDSDLHWGVLGEVLKLFGL